VSNPIPNLFKVPELKEKLLFTFLCLAIYRIGAHIATPGVNVDALADFLTNQGQGTLFQLYDLFAGAASRATVFALASCRTSRRASSSSSRGRCSR
jgi:preprotein translocase subunit SecY